MNGGSTRVTVRTTRDTRRLHLLCSGTAPEPRLRAHVTSLVANDHQLFRVDSGSEELIFQDSYLRAVAYVPYE